MVSATTQADVREAILAGNRLGTNGRDLRSLPPCERDFLLFEALAFDGLSTRQAAAQFDVSQTRVMQIRRHVAEWIARSVPEGLELTPRERMRLAAYTANGRVDSLYCEAMQAWRESKAPATTVSRGHSGEVRTPRSPYGDPRYLLTASRLAERQISLATKAARALEDAEPKREGESQTAPVEEAELTVVPPVRDCSPDAPDSTDAAKVYPLTIVANQSDETPCNELEERRQAFLSAIADDASPIHPPFTDAGGMLLDASEPATASAPLNRQQRRARQRQLERLRRKAR